MLICKKLIKGDETGNRCLSKYRFLGSSILNKILALIFVLISPIHTYAGFPEGETGYELKKIEQSFRLPCSEIGKDECLARVLSM